MNTISLTANKCSVHITTSRNRVKTYDSKVYLADGRKFELEIHNPHPFKVLAKIKLNGRYISSSGIILRPGERIYLERFIDQNQAFVFSTYEVDNTPQNLEAISLNGDVEVDFFSEYVPPITSHTAWTTPINQPWITYLGGSTFTTGASGMSMYSSNNASFAADSNFSNIAKSIETGRVEGGEKTSQEFTCENSSFNSWSFESVKLKIMPISQKPVTVGEIRNYCGECGTRVKKATWKFCPNCGTKF